LLTVWLSVLCLLALNPSKWTVIWAVFPLVLFPFWLVNALLTPRR
jgi:hypothetical protein